MSHDSNYTGVMPNDIYLHRCDFRLPNENYLRPSLVILHYESHLRRCDVAMEGSPEDWVPALLV